LTPEKVKQAKQAKKKNEKNRFKEKHVKYQHRSHAGLRLAESREKKKANNLGL